MRGEICIGTGSLLSFTALLLLIFLHVGQINTSHVPRTISLVNINMAEYQLGIAAAIAPDEANGLYTNNASTPLEQHQGLRQEYKFGLYSHCAYINDTGGLCSNSSAGNRFEPFNAIVGDMLANYSSISTVLLSTVTFTDSDYLGNFSNGAYYLILIGSICAALALLTGIMKHTFGFLTSTILAAIGSVMLMIGCTIWTVLITKTQSVNNITVGPAAAAVPLGINVTIGNGLYLAWAAFACLTASLIPYMIMAVSLFAAATVLLTGVSAIQKVSRAGRYLYTEDGNRFFIKGIAYQEQGQISTDPNNPFLEPEDFIDPLADDAACARDLPFLQELGVNAIRVYSVDSSLNHDACMTAFSNAGIYTIIDLSLPVNGSIDRSSAAWPTNLLDLYIGTIDAFSKYDNVLAYNIGNEVVINPAGTVAAPFIKAAARDTKAYLASKGSSALVGYAAIDGNDNWLDPLANYLSCDPSGANSGDTAIDLFGLNNYEYCGDAGASAYANKNGAFAGYNVPAYFSEFGCITSPPRLWTETQVLFSEPMSDIWSGGLAFSYFPATSSQGQFGMVEISADNKTVTTSADFDRLKAQYALVTFPTTPSKSSAGSTTYPSCPTTNSTWLASTTLPPTPNSAACACLESILSCQFTPQTDDSSKIVGPLLDQACGLLGQSGGSCDQIGGDGATGKYGVVSFCDPSTKLSFVMSEFYEATNKNRASCDFAGNATVNSAAPTTIADANAAASSCLSNPSATFVPTAPSNGPKGGNGNGNGNGNGGQGANNNSGALSDRQAWMGMGFALVLSVVAGAAVIA
ncbi:Glucanosyltransferase-domain-containing protein [Cristinia sonorae]|uniref:1,3-beta-glucanosyltransferase n=1 Tax=Cristinia sonorae TaxID=1940300 RepID=A0A8K0XPY1_9AGAR|nr:Glucanosyltransferase-domain-containing protein [Cristinia sonorae]